MLENRLPSKVRVLLIVLAAVSVPIALALLLVYRVVSLEVFAVGVTVWLGTFAIWAGIRRGLATIRASRRASGGADLSNSREWLLWQMRMKKQRVAWLVLGLPIGIWYGVEQRWWLLTIACVAINLLLLYATLRDIRKLKARLNFGGS